MWVIMWAIMWAIIWAIMWKISKCALCLKNMLEMFFFFFQQKSRSNFCSETQSKLIYLTEKKNMDLLHQTKVYVYKGHCVNWTWLAWNNVWSPVNGIWSIQSDRRVQSLYLNNVCNLHTLLVLQIFAALITIWSKDW